MKAIAIATVVGSILSAGLVTAAPAAPPSSETAAPGERDALSARHPNPDMIRTGDRYTDALNLLAANDYFDVTNLVAQGEAFAAEAWHDGQRVSVVVDPTSGSIQRRS